MNPDPMHKATSQERTRPGTPPLACRSQREVLLELLRSAVQRDAWLTLDEMARETNFPQASISAQLRHLRKLRYGAWKMLGGVSLCA